jgi:hypothetical protein
MAIRLLAGVSLALSSSVLLLQGTSRGASSLEAELRGRARGIAERTFIYERNYGGPHAHGRHKRRFGLRGQLAYTVKAGDGSYVTAFQATLDSADGTGDIVLLFDDQNFVGWASDRAAGNLDLGRRGDAILVRYWIYRGRNSICCPSGKKAITYRWTGSRVVSSGDPPLVYGKPGQRLHFGRRT